jgi:chorismate dehydratase
MTQPKRIGIPTQLFSEPLTRPLKAQSGFSLFPEPVGVNAVQLRSHRLDAALLGPLDYAREGSVYFIARGVSISSRSSNGSVVIHMREGVRRIKTLAVDPSSYSEIVLATIILREEFGIEPSVVPVVGTVATMLGKADAALLTGDQALRESPHRREALDLVESWVALTGLPYVFAVWCVAEHGLSPSDLSLLAKHAEEGSALIDEIAMQAPALHDLPSHSPAELAAYLESFSFTMTAEAEEGLKEYLKYVYYHGILADVPDLRYSPSSERQGEIGGN